MKSLIFLTKKRDKTIKARVCVNGITQRSYIAREEAASPMAAIEAIFITGVIEAKQNRDIMMLNIPNAFIQTHVPENGEKIIMKIRGLLVDIFLEQCPGVYGKYVVHKGKGKVLYVCMLMALYVMIVLSLLFYKKFRTDIESIGFEINPYNMFVANRMVNGKQHTVMWHINDVKSSHVNPK
eukprot:2276858-Ditylum_brightwellii.AAC.1